MPNDRIITREIIRQKLQDYVKKNISLADLQDWELHTHSSHECNDWEDGDSFTNEVLSKIDMSDIDGLSYQNAQKIIDLIDSNFSSSELITKLYDLNWADVKWTEAKIIHVLMKHSEDYLLFLLKKYQLEVGEWSPPYMWEEKLHFAYKLFEKVPLNDLIEELEKDFK